jgi:hypothetical protein
VKVRKCPPYAGLSLPPSLITEFHKSSSHGIPDEPNKHPVKSAGYNPPAMDRSSMRSRLAALLLLLLAVWACGGQPRETSDSPAGGTGSAVLRVERAQGVAITDYDAQPVVDPDIAAAWSGVRILLIDREDGTEQVFDIPINGADLLGDSGLVVSAGVFLPDFIMDENGITSRSPEPVNPAVRVIISEDGMEDFEGWLFASMPEIRPYPHDRFQVLLVEGIPADD